MLSSHESYAAILHQMAHFYCEKGWSVIPLSGANAPEKAKIPAVRWGDYQQRQPKPDEIDSWFLRAGHGGLGIVCGAVSGLVVLDFDDAERAKLFARSYPDLTDTLTVRSGGRGLPHYYYSVPESLRVETRRIAGADLQAEGCYVVAPPTAIGTQRWSVLRDTAPRELNQADLARIYAFFEVHEFEVERPTQAVAGYVGEGRQMAVQHWYRRLAGQIGRNNALFKAAAYARDTGWSQADVRACLVEAHITQPANGSHVAETPAQRYQEALRTIRSVYRRSPQIRTRPTTTPGLPNSIREKLLQLKQAAVARVLEGLLLVGVQPGHIISELLTVQLLQPFNIGRRAVQTALTALTDLGRAIFVQKKRTRSEGRKAKKSQKKCFFVNGANRVKIAHSQKQVGCPPRLFIMPSMGYLKRILGVQGETSDPLTPADLHSPRHYRMALQRALFRRRPGVYSRRWLCGRLGISVWTCRRYDRALGVNRQPTYRETPISWANIAILRENPTRPDGRFLETPDGRRYPPMQPIAAYLLPQYGAILLKERSWNYYSFDDEDSRPTCEISHNQQKRCDSRVQAVQLDGTVVMSAGEMGEQAEQHFWLCPTCHNWHIREAAPAGCEKCEGTDWQWISPHIWRDTQRCIDWWRRLRQQKRTLKPAKPGYDARVEVTAEQLIITLRALQPDSRLSRRRARDLVRAYGPAHVERVLRVLGQRRQVRNPTGFVIAVLRKENRYAEPGPVEPTTNDVQPDEPRDAWGESEAMRQLRESPYASFYANAHTFLTNDNAAGEGDVVR